ncbi:hypothetical protein [Rhodococcus pyridinivorans]|uniref:hypothetical protein n=1 Tax=Rhodococcus pyridinivorans TaxID=103816 RepID=UPI001585F906|nr:hypothetical protein [Rhodococcus pyridinivorans]
MDELTRAETRLIATLAVAAALEGRMTDVREILAAAGPDTTAEVAVVLAALAAKGTDRAEVAEALDVATLDVATALPDTTEAALIAAAKLEHEIGGRL